MEYAVLVYWYIKAKTNTYKIITKTNNNHILNIRMQIIFMDCLKNYVMVILRGFILRGVFESRMFSLLDQSVVLAHPQKSLPSVHSIESVYLNPSEDSHP